MLYVWYPLCLSPRCKLVRVDFFFFKSRFAVAREVEGSIALPKRNIPFCDPYARRTLYLNLLTPNDDYSGRTAPLTSKRCILYIYSTNIGTEYFKHGIYSPFFPLQNALCFINLTYLVPVYSHFIYRVC